jgi:hypothetical protein
LAGSIDDAATSDVLQQAIGEYTDWTRTGRNPSVAAATTQSQPTRIGLDAGDPDVARVFISHSSNDFIVVKALVELLRFALGLPSDQIRCTSLDGYRLPAGVHVDTQIRREVNGSELLLGVISPNSMSSLYVAVELGARWGTERPLLPLLANVDASVLGAPLSSLNALSLNQHGEVLQLVGDVARHLRLPSPRPEGYLDKVQALIKACQDQASIDTELGD